MRLTDIIPLNEDFFIWDAVVAWRDDVFKADFWNTTKSSYLLNMLRLIEADVVDVRLKLNCVNEQWTKEAKQKIDELPDWSLETKSVRKSCVNSFYNFVRTEFDYSVIPYQRHPEFVEIKHILSSTQDKTLTPVISPELLCNALSKVNERDAYIVWLMMHTGQKLDAILDLPKESLRGPYLDFKDACKHVPSHITDQLEEFIKNSKVYLFETTCGNRVTRSQVARNLKNAGYKIGLTFDLTPRVLHGYVMAYMSADKRSELQKTFC